MSEPIKVGDVVKVEWEHLSPVTGVVERIASDTGDSWRIHASDGTTVLVQLFARMSRYA